MLHNGQATDSQCPMLTAGTALVTAIAVLLTPSTVPHPGGPDAPATQLTAAVSPFDTDPLALTPTPAQALDFADVVTLLVPGAAAASGFADFIESLYLGVEPWVQYGVNLVAWAVGWVPFVGLLAPQINIFYDLGESVVRSSVFNTVEWLTGDIGFFQALSNVGSDTATAFNDFMTDQVNWIRHFLPPAPPIFPAAEAVEVLEPSWLADPGALIDLTPDPDGLSLVP